MRFALAVVGSVAVAVAVASGIGVGAGVSRTLSPALSAQTVAAADEQKLKAEVNAFMDQYWSLWSAGKFDELEKRIYHPMGQLSNNGHASVAQMKANFPATRKALVDRGYDHSNMPKRNICILSPTVAVISGRGIRYLKEDKVMAEFGWTYTLIKGADGWKMVSIYSHDPGKALTCSAN
jgi:hypothetical protein